MLTARVCCAESFQEKRKVVPNFDFERSLVGKRVKVYWPLQLEWYEGTVERYNVLHRKHKVVYTVRLASASCNDARHSR